ncbi:MAG TPA: nitroreductase [Puia sp.]|jgi:nitroreductase|nr:nitroreductase [Puia sp.]
MSSIRENPSSIEQINHLIRSRRSVFPDQFDKDITIPEDIIWQLLENANWAPNHKQTEPWRFVVFSGEGRKKIASFQATRYKETAGEKFRQDKYDKLLSNPLLCSHILAIILKRSTEVNIPEVEEISAVACAVENIYLSAAAYGLGGYWSTGGITYDPAARPFLGLEGEDRLLGLFYLGAVRIPSPGGKRGDIRKKTIWVKE